MGSLSVSVSEDAVVFGAVLAVVGGLLILIFGAFTIFVAAVFAVTFGDTGLAGTAVLGALIVGVVGVVFGILVIVLAALFRLDPEHDALWGSLVIVLAILSLFILGGGWLFGFVFATIGGACAIAFGEPWGTLESLESPAAIPRPWEDTESEPATATGQTPSPPLPLGSPVGPLKGCAACGKACPSDAPTCPNCGRAF
jgi:hypothetical protein